MNILLIERYSQIIQDLIKYTDDILRQVVADDELRLILDTLDPRGLYLHIMPQSRKELDTLRLILGM